MPTWNVKLTEIIKKTSDITSFRFDHPENLSYLPGQFFFVYIPTEAQGTMMHHFSFSSSPSEPFIEFTTRIRDSPFKNRLNQLEIGTYVKIASVSGQFSLTNEMEKVVFACGGIGITAARSIIKWIQDSQLKTDVILLYGNRTFDNIAFREELEQFEDKNFRVFHILSNPEGDWEGSKGIINSEFILASVPDFCERDWFISGPPAMVKSIKDILVTIFNISEGQIKTENYVGY